MILVISYLVLIFNLAKMNEADDTAARLAKLENHIATLDKTISDLTKKLNETKDSSEGSSCGADWIPYKDQKCFKVLGVEGSAEEAKASCKKGEPTATLITIQSQAEQTFLEKILQNYTDDYVWIGLEYHDNKFGWTDGRELAYTNWHKNAIKDGSSRCVQMSLVRSHLGKWTDDNCAKKFLVVCQKVTNSKSVLEDKFNNLAKVINDKIFPIGFIYTQLANQSEPSVLWPWLRWTDVTKHYPGHFFRAEGGQSAPFGTEQNASSPKLDKIVQSFNKYELGGTNEIRVEPGEDTPLIFSGCVCDTCNTFYALGYHVSNEEVRPVNTAIRLWKRTG